MLAGFGYLCGNLPYRGNYGPVEFRITLRIDRLLPNQRHRVNHVPFCPAE